jgi:hypothetical protein
MATTTTNFGWDIPQSTDLVKDGATAIAALGQDIDTAFIDLKGGTTGQVLAKASGTDLDFSWVAQDDSNAIQNAIVDAKGDLIAATAADTPARLAVGTNGHVLTADSTAATGIKWAAPAGGGKVLQVVSATTSTTTLSTSTTFSNTNLTASITPTASTSKVLIMLTVPEVYKSGVVNSSVGMQIARNGTAVNRFATTTQSTSTTSDFFGTISAQYLDSPATTSSTTYTLQIRANISGNQVGIIDNPNSVGSIILMEIGA